MLGRPVGGSPARALRQGGVPERGLTGVATAGADRARSVVRRRCAGRGAARMTVGRCRAVLIGRRARLPLSAQPLAGQQLPLRADLLGLRARRARAPRRRAGTLLDDGTARALPSVVRGRPRSRAARSAASLHLVAGASGRAALRARARFFRSRAAMTDIRRTILWVVFSRSLFLIYDAWSSTTASRRSSPPRPAPAPADAVAPPSAAPRRQRRCAPRPLPAPAGAAAPQAQRDGHRHHRCRQGHASTRRAADLVRLELLEVAGTAARATWYEPLLELFGMRQPAAPSPDVVLIDESADRYYVAADRALACRLPAARPARTTTP